MLYLSIHEGDDPDQTKPILGSTDPMVIRGVLDVLARRLDVLDISQARLRPLSPGANPTASPRSPGGDAE